MKLVLLGSPGAGKGTQAAGLSRAFAVPHLSTGEILRSHVKEGSNLGNLAKPYIDAGEYLPDELTNAMVAKRLEEPDARDGFILDGYPRTVSQAAFLDQLLSQSSQKLDFVVHLTIKTEEALCRLLSRGRPDDTEEVVKRRLHLYREQSAPVLAYYFDRLTTVEGDGELHAVEAALRCALRP